MDLDHAINELGPDREAQMYHAIGVEPDNTEVHKKLAELEEGLITLRQGQHHQVVILVILLTAMFGGIYGIVN